MECQVRRSRHALCKSKARASGMYRRGDSRVSSSAKWQPPAVTGLAKAKAAPLPVLCLYPLAVAPLRSAHSGNPPPRPQDRSTPPFPKGGDRCMMRGAKKGRENLR